MRCTDFLRRGVRSTPNTALSAVGDQTTSAIIHADVRNIPMWCGVFFRQPNHHLLWHWARLGRCWRSTIQEATVPVHARTSVGGEERHRSATFNQHVWHPDLAIERNLANRYNFPLPCICNRISILQNFPSFPPSFPPSFLLRSLAPSPKKVNTTVISRVAQV